MREISFRGKGDIRFNSGGWIYGVPIKDFEGDWQLCTDCTKTTVLPKTIGEYIGLTDKNGKKIFEGDIVKREYTLWHSETKKTKETQIGVVSYSNKDCSFCLDKVCYLGKPWDGETLEILGNIHDNPVLLEAKE